MTKRETKAERIVRETREREEQIAQYKMALPMMMLDAVAEIASIKGSNLEASLVKIDGVINLVVRRTDINYDNTTTVSLRSTDPYEMETVMYEIMRDKERREAARRKTEIKLNAIAKIKSLNLSREELEILSDKTLRDIV